MWPFKCSILATKQNNFRGQAWNSHVKVKNVWGIYWKGSILRWLMKCSQIERPGGIKERERARARARLQVCVWEREGGRACVCVRAWERVCVSYVDILLLVGCLWCVWEWERERERMIKKAFFENMEYWSE